MSTTKTQDVAALVTQASTAYAALDTTEAEQAARSFTNTIPKFVTWAMAILKVCDAVIAATITDGTAYDRKAYNQEVTPYKGAPEKVSRLSVTNLTAAAREAAPEGSAAADLLNAIKEKGTTIQSRWSIASRLVVLDSTEQRELFVTHNAGRVSAKSYSTWLGMRDRRELDPGTLVDPKTKKETIVANVKFPPKASGGSTEPRTLASLVEGFGTNRERDAIDAIARSWDFGDTPVESIPTIVLAGLARMWVTAHPAKSPKVETAPVADAPKAKKVKKGKKGKKVNA